MKECIEINGEISSEYLAELLEIKGRYTAFANYIKNYTVSSLVDRSICEAFLGINKKDEKL